MKKFIIKLILFLSPIIIFLLPPCFILLFSRENFSRIDKIIIRNEKYLIGYAYNEDNYRYLKWAYLTSNDKKDVWALGSSRVLQFRKDMFETSFYNAGYTISSINDFIPFLKTIPEYKYPKYLIVGLDQWMFNEKYDTLDRMPPKEFWKDSFSFYPKKTIYLNVYRDLFSSKYNLDLFRQDSTTKKIGLNAIINNKGFSNDGSIYYGDQIIKLINKDSRANDYNYADTYRRIENGGV